MKRAAVRSIAVAVMLLAMAIIAEAQQPAGNVPRIGYLSTRSGTIDDPRIEAFRQGLREFGYIEGKNIIIEYRYAEGRSERLPELAEELVRLRVDIIVAPGTPAVQAAKKSDHHNPYHLSRRGRSGCLWFCS